MTGGWREKLGDLRRAFRGGVPSDAGKDRKHDNDSRPPSSSRTTRGTAEIRADLGVDFGTRFTKVVMHLRHLDSRTPLTLGPDGTALHPARLAVRNGLAFPPDVSAPPYATWIDYLKMRLFAGGASEFDDGKCWPPEEIAALSALYLAGVLRLAQASAFKAGGLHAGAATKWFAQVRRASENLCQHRPWRV